MEDNKDTVTGRCFLCGETKDIAKLCYTGIARLWYCDDCKPVIQEARRKGSDWSWRATNR